MTRPTSDERWADATRQPDERRSLDRRAPAFIVEESDGKRSTWSVVTRYDGETREVFARDGLHARQIKAAHSALGTWAPEHGTHDPVREFLVRCLRENATDPNAVPNPTRLEVVR